MKHIHIVLFFLFLTACMADKTGRESLLFNNDWRFALLDDAVDASAPEYDDSGWSIIYLPHDWEKVNAHPSTKELSDRKGWYRKCFYLPQSDKSKIIYLCFDGVCHNSTFWLNGHLLENNTEAGFSFYLDITPYLKYGDEENILAVRTDNLQQPDSLRLPGSGIYRNVHLIKTQPIHISNPGTHITIPTVSREKAIVSIDTDIRNTGIGAQIELITRIRNSSGGIVVEKCDTVLVKEHTFQQTTQSFEIDHPRLWQFGDPHLYTAVSELKSGGKLIDRYATPFGISSVHRDSDNEMLLLDEKSMQINSIVFNYSFDDFDFGVTANKSYITREVKKLHLMRINAIRPVQSHYIPEWVEVCDRHGIFLLTDSFPGLPLLFGPKHPSLLMGDTKEVIPDTLTNLTEEVFHRHISMSNTLRFLEVYPHWNWKEGDKVEVKAYFSGVQEVELLLNEKSLGRAYKNDSTHRAEWLVPFSPGVLKVVGRRNGKEILYKTVCTAEPPARIRLSADRLFINAGGSDLSFVTIRIEDIFGTLVPYADNRVLFTVEGNGLIAGISSKNKSNILSPTSAECWVSAGKATIAVQSIGKKGKIRLKASSEGLPDTSIKITLK